jgi:hypothetical protein
MGDVAGCEPCPGVALAAREGDERQAMAKSCPDFGPASDCCPSCHDGVHIGEQDLLVIYRSDGSVYASVCCKKSGPAKEALREEDLE